MRVVVILISVCIVLFLALGVRAITWTSPVKTNAKDIKVEVQQVAMPVIKTQQ